MEKITTNEKYKMSKLQKIVLSGLEIAILSGCLFFIAPRLVRTIYSLYRYNTIQKELSQLSDEYYKNVSILRYNNLSPSSLEYLEARQRLEDIHEKTKKLNDDLESSTSNLGLYSPPKNSQKHLQE